MILRFAVDPTVPFTNNCVERAIQPIKIQQRTSGSGWRTLHGLIDFALPLSASLPSPPLPSNAQSP
jgi:transposase